MQQDITPKKIATTVNNKYIMHQYNTIISLQNCVMLTRNMIRNYYYYYRRLNNNNN